MDAPFRGERYYYTWGPHPPARFVASGSTLGMACPDADNVQADGTPLPVERRQSASDAGLFEGNPLAGPLFVEGLAVGEILAVDVLAIELDRSYGLTLLAPAHGALSRDQLFGRQAGDIADAVPRRMSRWEIDVRGGRAVLANPLGEESVAVPLAPMIGSIGVCPAWGETRSSLFAGTFGGNLDLPRVKPGATLFMPTFQPGGLLMLGDIHAAQGAGEIVGGGIETSGVATIRVRRLSHRTCGAPRLIVDGMAFALATDGDLRTATTTAYSRLLDWACEGGRGNRWDLHQLLSQTSIFEIGGISITSNATVAAGVAIAHLPASCRKELESWSESGGG